jgi:hypothetical protein
LIQLSQLPDDIQIYFSPGSNFFGKALLKVCWIGSVLFLQMNRFVNQTNGEVVSCRSVKGGDVRPPSSKKSKNLGPAITIINFPSTIPEAIRSSKYRFVLSVFLRRIMDNLPAFRWLMIHESFSLAN